MATYDPNNTDQQELIALVKRRIDEVTARGQSIGDEDGVFEELDDAADEVLRAAPYRETYPAVSTASPLPTNEGSTHTVVEAPDDYIRFAALRLSDWKRRVSETILPQSDLYRQQFTSYTSRDAFRPLVAEVPDGSLTSRTALHCFPQDTGPSLETFDYLGSTAPADMPTELVDAMTWEAASRVLQSQSDQGWQAARQRARMILFADLPSPSDNE